MHYADGLYTFINQGSDDEYYLEQYDTNFYLQWSSVLTIEDIEYGKLIVYGNGIKIITKRQSGLLHYFNPLLTNNTQYIFSFYNDGTLLDTTPLEMDYIKETDYQYLKKS